MLIDYPARWCQALTLKEVPSALAKCPSHEAVAVHTGEARGRLGVGRMASWRRGKKGGEENSVCSATPRNPGPALLAAPNAPGGWWSRAQRAAGAGREVQCPEEEECWLNTEYGTQEQAGDARLQNVL